MNIILASASPRRHELLQLMQLNFRVVPSEVPEPLDDNQTTSEVAEQLALLKATFVAKKFPSSLVIGADTIVEVGGKQLAKPANKQEAMAMLKGLAGTYNEVVSAAAVIRLKDNVKLVGHDVTRVYFKPYNELQTLEYIATGDSFDKAGGYGLQSGGAKLIDRIEGDFDTVMGLSTRLLASFLNQCGIKCEPLSLSSPVPQTRRS
ncbi:septum formation protein Maf [Candidatus Microgenomates bacterium]|nr:septum formation protein Maf [Candidatus Microgenomates bacterium]